MYPDKEVAVLGLVTLKRGLLKSGLNDREGVCQKGQECDLSQRAQAVQRPWGRTIPGVLEEQQGGLGG